MSGPRIEVKEGDVIRDGTQWLTVIVNGWSLNAPIHVYPEEVDRVKSQLVTLVSEGYTRGYRAGASATQSAIKDALGIS